MDFVDEFLKFVAEDDNSFNCEVLRIGSVFEGYRIGKLDEFDYMCELKFLLDGRCEIFEIEELGFVRVRVKEDCREEWKMFLFEEGFFDIMKVKSFLVRALYVKCGAFVLVRKVWNLSFNIISYDLCVFCRLVISISKVGIKMILYWRGNIYKFMLIDIDITFVIYFVSWFKFVKVFSFYVLKDYVGLGYYVVFKFEGGNSLLWRLLFFIVELNIL